MSNSSQLDVLNNDFTLTITDEAAKRVRDVVNGGLPETAGLRVGVVGGERWSDELRQGDR